MDFTRQRPTTRGRGAAVQPDNPYLSARRVDDLEHVADDEDYLDSLERPITQYLPDESQSIVSTNDSPDVGFNYSVNPYRGCAHGCSYCYARPGHEYLGMSAGIDFETKIMVKHRAPELLREFLARPRWAGEVIVFSGVTDCYQPVERELQLTRGCLEVAAECRQPIGIITKNALVTRDIDVLSKLAEHRAVRVSLSVTTLDQSLARIMEPRTSSPAARLRAIAQLSAAGIETHVMIGPVIPGLNDSEIPAILKGARDAGAVKAGFVLLRLPTTVREVFLDWLHLRLPNRASRVESFIRSTRGGKLNSSKWRDRQVGRGPLADQIGQTFAVFAKKYGLAGDLPPLNREAFRPPSVPGGQLNLF